MQKLKTTKKQKLETRKQITELYEKKQNGGCRHPVWFNEQQKQEFDKLKLGTKFPEFIKLLFNNEIIKIKRQRKKENN